MVVALGEHWGERGQPVLLRVEAVHYQQVVVRVDGDGHRVVELGGGGTGGPVHRIDADVGGREDRAGRFGGGYGVVADDGAGAGRVDGWAQLGVLRQFLVRDAVADGVGGDHPFICRGGEVLDQLHHGLAALAEPCEDEGPALIVIVQIIVKCRADVLHRQGEEFLYRRLSVHPDVEGNLPVEGAVEPVLSLGENVLGELHRGEECLDMVRAGVVGVAAGLPVRGGPVPDAGG